MSTLGNNPCIWRPISSESLDTKYEKCRNITEEIYKRINITFQIKNLETATQSESENLSDQIDSNDLSNETDLFAYEKSDSISSSVSEREAKSRLARVKFINLNNNEEKIKKSVVPIYQRPKKRYRKRVKKRTSKNRTDSECSSDDEALPLSRIADLEPVKRVKDDIDDSKSESPDNVMGVPKITILKSGAGGELRCVVKEPQPRCLSKDKKKTSPVSQICHRRNEGKPTREQSKKRCAQ